MFTPRGLLKRAVMRVMCLSQLDRLLLGSRRGLTIVLSLHRVSPVPNPYFAPLHPRDFEGLLQFLSRHAIVRGLRDEPSKRRDKPQVILSFDDGYLDFVEYAMPLLAKYEMRANQNVIPANVERGTPSWDVALKDRLCSAPRSLLEQIQLPVFPRRPVEPGDEGKARFSSALSRALKLVAPPEREAQIEEVNHMLRDVPYVATRIMSVRDIREAAKYHEVGGHSWSHESMSNQTDTFFREDLRKCFDWFDRELELPMDIYAFPSGSYREHQIEILRDANVKHILLVDHQMLKGESDVYPRLPITAFDADEARLRAAGLFAMGTRRGETRSTRA